MQELDIPSYDHIVVLGYSDLPPPNAADARTIITLTHLRDILHESDRTTNVISEIINAKNQPERHTVALPWECLGELTLRGRTLGRGTRRCCDQPQT